MLSLFHNFIILVVLYYNNLCTYIKLLQLFCLNNTWISITCIPVHNTYDHFGKTVRPQFLAIQVFFNIDPFMQNTYYNYLPLYKKHHFKCTEQLRIFFKLTYKSWTM